MIKLLTKYNNTVKNGLMRNPEELSTVFFYLLETIEIEKNNQSHQTSIEEENLEK